MSDTENIDEGNANASESNGFWMSLNGLWAVFGICFVAFMMFYFGTIYISTVIKGNDNPKSSDKKEFPIDNETTSNNSLSPNEARDTAGLANYRD